MATMHAVVEYGRARAPVRDHNPVSYVPRRPGSTLVLPTNSQDFADKTPEFCPRKIDFVLRDKSDDTTQCGKMG